MTDHDSSLTINELVDQYEVFAKSYYGPVFDGSGESQNVKYAVEDLKALFGTLPVSEFGPKKLKAVREAMIAAGLARHTINDRIGRVKRIFKWAVSEELAPQNLAHALGSVDGLRMGRTAAKEKPRVKPVDDLVIVATVKHLSPVLGDMVRFQRLTGCRPGEVRRIKPCEIDRGGDVWIYRPARHKTQHHGKERTIFIGPRAQVILAPYLKRQRDSFCFSPAESEKIRKAEVHTRRKSKVQPSQVDRRKANPRYQPKDFYGSRSYNRAIERACTQAWVPRWSPNQLRHSAATEIRKQFGLEAAQVVLGHSRADVTQVYAERDSARAIEAMGAIG